MRKDKKIKDMSIYEASEFWDDHNFLEFEDIEEIENVRFSLKKKKYIGLDMTLYKKIKDKADKLHLPEDDLINKWLLEKIH
ncbi:MAG: hypothetical protein FJ117_22195 [Deltaproteobacteria bacterium]|nr:hypothetical protein [Deltaproteobacteria bacterium]